MKLSIISPVRNGEKYLDRCIKSLLEQTLKHIEIIFIDDASTDDSPLILEKAAKNSKSIKVITAPSHVGSGAAKNMGLAIASGEYVGFVDCDDFIAPDMYERLYNRAHEQDSDLAKGVIFGYDNENEECFLREWYDINHIICENKFFFSYGFTSAIVRRRLIVDNGIRFPEELVTMEDPCFIISCVLAANDLVIDDEAFYFYTRNHDSVTSILDKDSICASTICAAKIIFDKIRTIEYEKDARIAICVFAYHMLYHAILDASEELLIREGSEVLNEMLEVAGKKGELFAYYCLYRKKLNISESLRNHRMWQIEQYMEKKKYAPRVKNSFSAVLKKIGYK